MNRLTTHRRADPKPNCRRCPRLSAYVRSWRKSHPDWFNAPVPTWIPEAGDESVTLLIIGLAPGLRGANRTGIPFTGDASGDLLFSVLEESGLAIQTQNECLLIRTAITNAVRCVPPDNRPSGAETSTCRDAFLKPTLRRFRELTDIVALGRTAHEATVRAMGAKVQAHPFTHGACSVVGSKRLHASYHCSRYNVNTGRITRAMLADVFGSVLSD